MTKAQSNVKTALLVRLGFESYPWLVDLISAPGWRSWVLPKGVFKAIHWCIKQIYSKYWLFKLGKRGILLMYLQLLELCPFVHYFSHWRMLILQLNVLLVYIFKVVSGCDFFFFFNFSFVLKHYQGWDSNVLLPPPSHSLSVNDS